MGGFIKFVEKVVFSNRPLFLLLFVAFTGFLGYKASHLKVDAGFEKQLPLTHPFIQTFLEYRAEFGGANRIIVSISPKEGTIFKPEFFKSFKEINDEVYYISGVNRASIKSIFTPNVRFVEIVDGGLSGGKVVPADFQYSPDDIERVRKNLLKSSVVGRLVASDFTAAAIHFQLSSSDPKTGEKLDYLEVARQLEEKVRQKYQNPDIEIHIIGFAKAIGDVAKGAKGVLVFLALSILLTVLLVYYFIKSWRFSLLLVFCSLVAVVWDLGALPLLGMGLDPMSILVPFLICAIGVSHGIQILNGVNFSIYQGMNCHEAARASFRRLVVPGVVALFSDTIGFITIYLIEIQIIQELAIIASLGVLGLILTNLILLPILLSYLKTTHAHVTRVEKNYTSKKDLWIKLSAFASPRVAAFSLGICILITAAGWFKSQDLKIGDLLPGVPALRQDSRYNMDTSAIVEKYSIGVDILNVLAETKKDGCIDYDVMRTIDDFQWVVSNNPNVQGAVSLPYVAKIIASGWNEGHFKWKELSRNSHNLVQAISSIETSTGLLNSDCSVMPIMIFTRDHKAESIESILKTIEVFSKENENPKIKFRLAKGDTDILPDYSDVKFRLATGNVGVMAATNQVVESAQYKILMWIYGCVIILCLCLFRSVRATICVVLPLAVVSVLAYAVMAALNIGLKTSTLPVAAFGVGIGVDYGIYIFTQLLQHLKNGEPLRESFRATLESNGNAVLVTGLTLSLSVSTWIFSDLQFQADMGILFSFMLFANLVGAICLVPAVASVLYPKNRAKTPLEETDLS